MAAGVPRASILIPIHDKPTTLPLTVDTVLRQSVRDLEVLLIGDGISEELRGVVEQLLADDARVRLLDFPKGPHHGECYRHDAIAASRSEAIFYLCDDDLLLPDHVADLLALLEDHTFVQSYNGYCRPDGSMRFYAADLANPHTIGLLLLDEPPNNAVSITGTAHRRDFYERVGDRWETTPPGRWPDHYQWSKLMRHPDFSGATSHRMTALQFPTSQDGRDAWSDAERAEELRRWHRLVTGPDPQVEIDARVHVSALGELASARDTVVELRAEMLRLRRLRESADARTVRMRERLISKRQLVVKLRRRVRRLRARLEESSRK